MGFLDIFKRKETENKKLELPIGGHYILRCKECGEVIHIPADTNKGFIYGFNPKKVRLYCVYGAFTVNLDVNEFFDADVSPPTNRTLHASIVDNMKVIHRHLLTHNDPLYLTVTQTANSTTHKYDKKPVKNHVKYTKPGNVEIIGSINKSKAEIPGISWQI